MEEDAGDSQIFDMSVERLPVISGNCTAAWLGQCWIVKQC